MPLENSILSLLNCLGAMIFYLSFYLIFMYISRLTSNAVNDIKISLVRFILFQRT